MQFVITFFGALALYSTSKYFPVGATVLRKPSRASDRTIKYFALGCLLLAAVLSTAMYGIGTGLFVFIASLILSFCCLLIIVPLNKRWIYFTVTFCLVLIILENLRCYAS